MDAPETIVTVLRLCVDLNVWIGQYLADARGLKGTASQTIIEALQNGRAGVGPVQGVISYSMLSRLHDVLVRKGATVDNATRFVTLIEAIVSLGPSSERPSLVLGGGVHPTSDARLRIDDPYLADRMPACDDAEDGRVLDVAIARRADVLVTWNFRDFVDRHDEIVLPGRLHIRKTADHRLTLIQPPEMAAWLRTGVDPRQKT